MSTLSQHGTRCVLSTEDCSFSMDSPGSNSNPTQISFTGWPCSATTLIHVLSSFVWAALVAAGLFAVTAATTFAQTQSEAVIPNLITQPINPDARVTLEHNVHPLAQARFDQGAAPGSMATGRIMLVLQRSGIQDLALKQYLGDLQNPNSPNYRKWITPAQYGKLYGISDSDLTTLTAWLESQGFTVEKVPQARNVIIFSGNVAQIQQAFHTSIHRYSVNGELHFANASDPQIPAALAPVIGGIASLNDFRPRAGARLNSTAHFDAETQKIKSDLTLSSGSTNFLFVGPADAATIYDTPNPSLNGKYSAISQCPGTNGCDGTGVTIGIVGDSNGTQPGSTTNLFLQDVALYRAGFLPSSYSSNQPNIIVDGNDPGINGDAVEALLDLQVSSGIAPGAKVNFYTSANTDLQQGLFLAIYRALDDNAVSILNVSFGNCEATLGTSGNLQVLNAWQQAAAQGISVTISTGDSGSAGCDNENTETVATGGLQVNGFASTPYNIAVGGTDYNILASQFATYVSTSNSASNFYRTALSYIPENPWNDSPAANTGSYTANTPFKDSKGNTNIVGGGGGISSCINPTTSGNTVSCTGSSGYPQPAFQAGITNSVSSSARTLPDVSLLAADEAYGATWVVCSDNVSSGSSTAATDCQQTNGSFTSSTTFTGVGGTSASNPAFAGMLALISQSQGGVRLGQADYVLYNLAGQAALYPTLFHDVTAGNNSVYCQSGSPNCGSNSFLTGYNAGTGYDAATGLGSVDVTQLIANWSKASFIASSTSLTINGSTAAVSVAHGTSLNFAVSVSPTAATGDVAIVNNNTNNASNGFALQNGGLAMTSNSQYFLTLSSGAATGTSNALPGGNYTVMARYGGDKTYAASTSTGIAVSISPENSTTSLNVNIYDASTGNSYTGPASSVPYGLYNFAVAQPYGNASAVSGSTITPDGLPTGTVNFLDNNNALATSAIASNGAATYTNSQVASQSFSVGSHSVTAKYNGDLSFNPSTSSAQAITVVQASTTTAATSSATSVGSATSVTISVAVGADSIGVPPSGTIQLYNGSTAIGSATTLVQAYSATTGLVQSTASITLTGSQIGAIKVARQDRPAFPWALSGGAVAIACVFFLSIPARRRSWGSLLGLVVVAIVISGAIGCGSGGGGGGGGGGSTTASVTAKYSGDTNYTTSTSTAITITVTQ